MAALMLRALEVRMINLVLSVLPGTICSKRWYGGPSFELEHRRRLCFLKTSEFTASLWYSFR